MTQSILQAFGTATAFTITNANLASSPTAGWQSNAIDNTGNLYVDALVMCDFAAVNTAPSASKAIFFFAFAIIDTSGSAYTNTGSAQPSGSEGTLTYPDVTANPIPAPLLGILPYPTQNNILRGGPWSVARCFGGILPPKWAIGMVNNSNMTLSVTSIKYIGVYNTVG